MILVIGGGPAGRMAAVRLASHGKPVTILEKRSLGGQCVHDGCMLICGLNDVARSIRNAEFLNKCGAVSGSIAVNYSEMLEKLEEVQAKLAMILERETLDAGVKIEYGVTAEVSGSKILVNGEEREAEAVIIATGAEVVIPEVSGNTLSGVYTNRTIKLMRSLPKSMVIVGGGISAAEFAYIYAAFGVEVHLVARSRILSMLPEKLRKNAFKGLAGVHCYEFAKLEEIIGNDSGSVTGVRVNGEELPCEAVLFTCGMNPDTPYVNGLLRNPDGSIKVNEKMETSVPNVYACGDVTGYPYFTPVSRLQGFAAADAILGVSRDVDIRQFPFTVVLGSDYTVYPAVEEGYTITSPNIAGPETFWHVLDASIGRMELTVSPKDGKILGFASSGPGTGLVGTYLGYLARSGVSVYEFSKMLEVHPISDGLYTLVRAAADKPWEKSGE